MFYNLPTTFSPLLYRMIKWYYRKPRWIQKRDLRLRLEPTVFHPGLYLSTDILLDHVMSLDLMHKRVLELGCGSGFISLYLAEHRETHAYASDINQQALDALEQNADTNDLAIELFHSDLFEEIPFIELDYILINPPYYQREATAVDEYAFFAGKDLAYFQALFYQITDYLKAGTKVLMVLSKNAPLAEIKDKARKNHVRLEEVLQTKRKRETFFIYSLSC